MEDAWEEGGFRHGYVRVGDVRLHCVERGAGPLVLLLHGFPEFWFTWRHVMTALAGAGFRAVAPDLRGVNLSDKPPGIAPYDGLVVTEELAALIAALGAERAFLVGHDIGGALAWVLAMLHPERVERLAILNMPHPQRFVEHLSTFRQKLRSWYVFFFRLPWLPELAFRAFRFKALRWILSTQVRPGAHTQEDVEKYVEAMSRPGALNRSINYYRAFLRRSRAEIEARSRPIHVATLIVWGENDLALGKDMVEPNPGYVTNLRVHRLPDAGHFVHHDEPERVHAWLIDHFRSVS